MIEQEKTTQAEPEPVKVCSTECAINGGCDECDPDWQHWIEEDRQGFEGFVE